VLVCPEAAVHANKLTASTESHMIRMVGFFMVISSPLVISSVF
jgi:hypothetical protein